MYLIYIFEGKDKKECTPIRIVAPTSFNIELKGLYINFFDEEAHSYQTEYFDSIDVLTERKTILLYRFTKETKND